MQKLRKKGETVSPVKIAGRTIASTFWGKAWCDNLESYRDYENRLPRGRAYVRNGSVVDLRIASREVKAKVSGSSIYAVSVKIGEVPPAQWKSICADCAGGIDSLVALLRGKLSKGVMERISRQQGGLFPKPSEIGFSCTCPDYASMCKHVAAALYGVGARLDEQPELLFLLRAVDPHELVADIDQALPMAKKGPTVGKVLNVDDMAALFGLDMVGEDGPADDVIAAPSASRKRKVAGSPRAKGATAARGDGRVVPKTAARKAAPSKQAAQPVAATRKRAAVPKVAVPKQAIAGKTAVPKHGAETPAEPPVSISRRKTAASKPAASVDPPARNSDRPKTRGKPR